MKYLLPLVLVFAASLSAETYVLLENDFQERITFFGMKQTPGGDMNNLLAQPLDPNGVHIEQSGIPDGVWNFYFRTESDYVYSYEGVNVSCGSTVCTLILKATDFPAVLAPPPSYPPDSGRSKEEDMSCSTGATAGYLFLILACLTVGAIAIRLLASKK